MIRSFGCWEISVTKYLEIGFGNTWWLRTEIEQPDGTEVEVKGWLGPIRPQSCYLRLWFGHQVLILDSREGLKRQRKTRSALKVILGLVSS